MARPVFVQHQQMIKDYLVITLELLQDAQTFCPRKLAFSQNTLVLCNVTYSLYIRYYAANMFLVYVCLCAEHSEGKPTQVTSLLNVEHR